MQERINKAIDNAAEYINELIKCEWPQEDAIAHVRENSTLSAASWQRVLAKVN